MNNEIIVGYDGREGSQAALEEAAALARDLGSAVGVVFSYEPPAREGGEVADLRAAVRELGSAAVAAAGERLTELGVPYEILLVDERPAEGLVRVAEDRDARMIVVGGKGERPLARALLGSTVDKLLHLTDRPVLVVRADEDE